MPSHPISGEAARQASQLLSRLRRLECPLVEELDDARFADLALQPCEWRQRLLVWLLNEMDATLAQSVSAQKGSLTSGLLDLFSSLGLCSAERQDLVSGSARRLDQLAFFSKVLRVVLLTRYQSAAPDAATDDDIVDVSLGFMNSGLAQVPLARSLTSTTSYLRPEWGLQFRAEVEKRKAEEGQQEPLAWRLAAWENEVKAVTERQAEKLERLPQAEFLSAADSGARTEALDRLRTGMERFVAAHRRAFKTACEQRRVMSDDFGELSASARRRRAAEVEEFGTTFGRLGERLAAVGTMAEGARKMEEELKRMAAPELAAPSAEGGQELVEEMRRLVEEMKA